MEYNAFTMKLKKGCEEEYKRRHDALWPELESELKAAGILIYAIYLDETGGTLFAFQKLEDGNTADDLPEKPVMRKWWAHMADIMEVNDDDSPVCFPLREMFRLEK